MAKKGQVMSEMANQKREKGDLGPLREIMRQYDEQIISREQLNLFAEHKNPFDQEFLVSKPGLISPLPRPRLDRTHFRVDSSRWIGKTEFPTHLNFKSNHREDIKETVEIPLKCISNYAELDSEVARKLIRTLIGVQYFTQGAALRETKKAGKQLPTIADWLKILSDFYKKSIYIYKTALNAINTFSTPISFNLVSGLDAIGFVPLKMAGFCGTDKYHRFMNLGDSVYYWCRETNVSICFSHSQREISIGNNNQGRYFPVRCLK